MMKRKGLSEVVSTVLMVMITIAAIAFVANLAIPFVRNNLQHSTECLSARDSFKFDNSQGYDCYDQTGLYGFSVKAGNGGDVAAVTDQILGQPHSADYNKDWRIDLAEWNRVNSSLYGYRSGTTRTGEYHCDSTTIDGYAPGPTGNHPCQPHSADEDSNWKIDLMEFSRVTELYNYKVQGVRTGEYHVQAGTEDGYASGPMTQSGSAASIGNNITGFALVFGSSSDSATIKVFDGTSTNNAQGGARMLNKTLTKIYVSRPGEVQTYVYNAGSAKYSQIDIYPILNSGRLCDKSDGISVSLCKGVSLTP